MADPGQLWVLAGGNGVGKSTFYRLYLEGYGIPFVNADLIARDLNPENPEGVSYHAATRAKADPLPEWTKELLPLS